MQNVPKTLSLIFHFEIVEYAEDTCFEYVLIHLMDQIYLKKSKSEELFEIYLKILQLYIKTQWEFCRPAVYRQDLSKIYQNLS